MANAKKKQDDKNFKILRELAALPNNKQCFECHQRGPTYVDMTVGSFVCTSCSGLLRGLNPPHRVKSISMATFTVDEIAFIKSKGNEYCHQIWMGKCESGRGFDETPYKDETQMKDFLISKYEKKRWYVSPSEVLSKQAQTSDVNSFNPIAPKSMSAPIAIGHGSAGTACQNTSMRPSLQNKLQTSNVKDMNNVVNKPVTCVSPVYSLNSCASRFLENAATFVEPAKTTNGGGEFANFANFEAFQDNGQNSNSLLPATLGPALTPLSNFGNQSAGGRLDGREPGIPKSATVPLDLSKPSTNEIVDKYSALAELDELFRNDSSASSASTAATNVGGTFSDLSFAAAAGSFGATAASTALVSNPFTGFPHSSFTSTPAINSLSFSATGGDLFAQPGSFPVNPFRPAAPHYANPFVQPVLTNASKLYATQSTAMSTTTSQPWTRPQNQFLEKLPSQSNQQVKWNPFL